MNDVTNYGSGKKKGRWVVAAGNGGIVVDMNVKRLFLLKHNHNNPP